MPSRCGAGFGPQFSAHAKSREKLEKFLLFGGKYHSCRGPPDFRFLPPQNPAKTKIRGGPVNV